MTSVTNYKPYILWMLLFIYSLNAVFVQLIPFLKKGHCMINLNNAYDFFTGINLWHAKRPNISNMHWPINTLSLGSLSLNNRWYVSVYCKFQNGWLSTFICILAWMNSTAYIYIYIYIYTYPGNKVQRANMGPIWVLSAPDGPHVGPIMNLVIMVAL